MKTRTKSSVKASSKSTETTEPPKSTAPKVQLGPEASNPPRLFILPDELSPEARIVTLTNPRYGSEERYIICPEQGLYEFTRIAAPKTTPRSWLLTPELTENGDCLVADAKKEPAAAKGFVSRDADLFIATSIDPLFFLLPALSPPTKKTEPTKKLFLSGDDYMERIAATSMQFSGFMRTGILREILEKRLVAVCESAEAGDESMYRLSEEKILEELLKKARTVVEKGLPASMEEKLVRKALDAPMLSIKREDTSALELAKEEEASTDTADTPDTQTTVASTATSFSNTSTAATSFSEVSTAQEMAQRPIAIPITAPEGVAELLRLRTALSFICSNYIPPYISDELKKTLKSATSPIDFAPLDDHLVHLAKLRQEAVASRSMGDYSRKRGMDEDDETIELRAEKKRKKDEDEKRKKAGMSQGVKKLAKVNVTGMKKMSDFFKKKPA